MSYKAGGKVIVTKTPRFSTVNRTGEKATIRELIDEHGDPYLAVEEDILRMKPGPSGKERRVSWPLDEKEVRRDEQ